MANLGVNPDFWKGRRVFVTGDTGFKGAWLSLWLKHLAAQVTGYALEPPTSPSLFECTGLNHIIRHIHGDIRDFDTLAGAMAAADPDIVFHLAAQALVFESYRVPIETFSVNIMGTVNVLEASRAMRVKGGRRQAIIVVTSDKCYAQNGSNGAYREADPIGGNDPYSSSKGCAELVTAAYHRSFADADIGIATVRAGNVVGGGDWAKNRLVPDAVRAFLAKQPLIVRHPKATRPFQHVLDPLAGYLLLAQSLYENPSEFSEGWNFGPSNSSAATVEDVLGILASVWGTSGSWVAADLHSSLPEAEMLALDSSKAQARLHWRPLLDLKQALRLSAEWYLEEAANPRRSMCDFTLAQIRAYAGQS